MQLPQGFLNSLNGIKGFDIEAFEKVHQSYEQVTSIRINTSKLSIENCQLSIDNKVPWTEFGYYLNERPSFTFDPLFHAGCYYVQEASSMFLEQALKQTVDLSKSLRVLDLCAAPGGKSTHIQSLISKDSLLVSNEVIQSRVNILKQNIIKWGYENVVVTNNDPKDFAKLENYFDVIVVDAPCSGSGLFRKDPEAIEEWSEKNVELCSHRQKRILNDVLPALKKEGILIYSTCSYSKKEDEDIAEWMMNELLIANCQLSIENNWNITKTDFGYRFWPDKVKGEGFFIACFKKRNGERDLFFRIKNKPFATTKKEMAVIEKWLNKDSFSFIKQKNIVHAIPEKLFSDIAFLAEKLNVKYYGVEVGEIVGEKLIPDHSLAMSNIVNENISSAELNPEQAIEYLKKKELKLSIDEKGWMLVKYKGHSLGWINVLPNRINNYYPKELRILKDS